MTDKILSQKQLKKLLHYNRDTGVFTWKVYRNHLATIGAVAGCVNTFHNNKKYRVVRILDKLYLAHRLAFLWMDGAFPKEQVDHINGNGLDNRWVNMRCVTNDENHKNVRKNSNNTSGHTGVRLNKLTMKFESYITINGKKKHLGLFNNIEDAVKTRKDAETTHGYHVNHGTDRPL